MLSEKMGKALNEQINAELHSAYLYLSMAAYFESANLKGFAHWMRIQAQEETGHAMRFFDFIHDRGGKVTLTALEAPKTEWKNARDAFAGALEHERYISGRINKLVALARDENDYASDAFLQWFVNEQVEEEATADLIVQQLTLIGDSTNGLFMMDHQLAKREG